MLNVTNVEVAGLRTAIRGMRNPLKSWDKSDSFFCTGDKCFYTSGCKNPQYNDNLDSCPLRQMDEKGYNRYMQMQGGFKAYIVGINDLKLMQSLIKAGTDHSKFMRMINVTMDITAPLYWWKEMDQYRVGVTTNSESTMHTLSREPITLDMFSFDGMAPEDEGKDWVCDLITTVHLCETYRKKYIETKNKAYWRRLIQLLPNAWNQKRTWTANYQVLRNIYFARRNHKLEEWRHFCEYIEQLPYGKELICYEPGGDRND